MGKSERKHLSLLLSCESEGQGAALTIDVVFVRPQENFLAISESGNIFLNNFVAWSVLRNARLCFATNIAQCAIQ